MTSFNQDQASSQDFKILDNKTKKESNEEKDLKNLLPNFLMEKLIMDDQDPSEIPNKIWDDDETSHSNYAVIKVYI